MAIDPALEAAIKQAVADEGQPDNLAQRLIAWLEALGEGDLRVEQQDGFYARLIGAVVLGDDDDAH